MEEIPNTPDITDPHWQQDFVLRARLERAGIPRRYLDCTVRGYETANETQTKARAAIATYLRAVDGLDPLKEPAGLLLTGPRGTGKTHLAIAAVRELVRRGRSGLYLQPVDLFTRIKATFGKTAFGEETEQDILDELDAVAVLLLDDLGSGRSGADWEIEKIYQICDHRLRNGKILLATTNHDFPGGLTEYVGERVVSRLYEMCRIVSLAGAEDYRLKFQG